MNHFALNEKEQNLEETLINHVNEISKVISESKDREYKAHLIGAKSTALLALATLYANQK